LPVARVYQERPGTRDDEQQRYRAYAVQDVSALNADQRAALVALPALEGAYKELEDLVRDKGPVEVGSAPSGDKALADTTGAGAHPVGKAPRGN
jgi:hypothetical protein